MEKRPTTIEDLARLRQVNDPQISPDGTRIAFTLKSTNLDKNRYETHIWLLSTAPPSETGGTPSAPRQWTFSPKGNETSPRWSPDGKRLAFISERDEGKTSQIYLLSMEGGEAERLTDLPPGNVNEIAWSPDGQKIAFRFRAQDEDRTEEAGEERKKKCLSSPPREITRMHYRSEGTGFIPEARWGVWVLDTATRSTLPLLPTIDRDYQEFAWSPDGQKIAYTQNVSEDPDLLPNAVAVFVTAIGGTESPAEPQRMNAPLGPKYSLSWSPDGTNIAYLGHDKADEVWGVTNIHPWIVPTDGQSPARDMAAGWDVHAGNAAIGDVNGSGESGPVWTEGGRSILFLATDRGTVDIYSASLSDDADAAPKRLTEGVHAVTGFTTDATGDTIALLLATPGDAGDLYLYGRGSAFFRRLTRLNDELLDTLDLPSPTYFEAPSPEGHTVPCWALLPPGYQESPSPRPTILYIHGGPHLGYTHTLFHEYQALAAAGYVVIYPNPRGSKGYGEAWTSAIKGNWGEPAQADCLACVDYAIAQGWTDPAKVGVAGGSYGGYLTGWVVGNAPERWAAAVAERGVFNLLSMAGTCDFVWRDKSYFNANATSDPAEYLRNSPLTYADKITAPLLIIHSEGDLRCPIEQAEQLFAALKRAEKRDVTFLRYGAESNHNLSRGGPPDLRLDRQQRIHAWFDKYLKGE